MSDLIYPYGVLRIFLSLQCNFKCAYCSMNHSQPDLWRGEMFANEEVTPDMWIKALARVKPQRPNFIVTFCNAEPALYKGCADIVNSIPQFGTFMYTNCSTESLKEIAKITPRDNLNFYVSYHRGQIPIDEFIDNAKWLQEHYIVSNFHAPAYPPIVEQLKEDAKVMKDAGVKLVTDHEYLGLYQGKMYYSYLGGKCGGGKWVHDRFASRLEGVPEKTVLCKQSFNHESYFARAYTVAPNGNMYVCWRYLYNHSDEGIVGNFFDPEFQFKDEFFECKHYGDCNFCAWHNMILDKETGEKLDDDILDMSEEGTVSACMIVKNEEEYLPDCLASLQSWVDEIIVVDTGSTDKTIEIAKSFGAIVYEQPWQDDFSFHRNFSMTKATKEWIFIIDADERVLPEDGKLFKQLAPNIKQDIVAVDVLNLFQRVVKSRFGSLRFFRRSYNPEYEGKVHNRPQVKNGASIYRIPFKIYHIGYDLPKERMAQKYERTLAMCKKFTEEEPDTPHAWFDYGRAMWVKDRDFNMAEVDKMESAFLKVLELSGGKNTDDNIFLQTLYHLSTLHYAKKNFGEAIKYGKMAVEIKPDYLDCIFMVGISSVFGASKEEAEEWLQKYLDEQKKYDFEGKLDAIVMVHCNQRELVYQALADIEKLKEQCSIKN